MNHFYIIFLLYSTAVISFSYGEEVHAEEPSDKPVKSSYTYSIEYSDAGNHGKYGHKIQVTDGNAKVNVHSEHPQIEEQVKQQKIQSQSKPIHVKQQVLAYAPSQGTQTVGSHYKEQHSPVQLVQVQKAPSSGKLPIDTLDKQQLAILLAQNRNPFLPLTEHKDVKASQPQKPGVTKTTSPENQHTVSYYVPQGHSHYQLSAQSSKDASAYQDPKIQYTYQYQPSPVQSNLVYDTKVQYASVPNQQQYYYPETPQLNNQVYQNYYQHQIPATTSTAQPQIQYNIPFTQQQPQQYHQQQPQHYHQQQPQQYQQQQQPQQYVYLPQTVPQTSGGHAQQYSYGQLQGDSQHGGPVQFLPSHQSQNSHTYPTTPFYNIPKGVSIPANTPELSAYPPSLFSNVQYGSSMYGSSAAHGYKPVVEAPQTGKANQYETFPAAHGISYGTGGSINIGNEIQSGLFKPSDASAPVQDTKSSNFYATAANLPQGSYGNLENLAQTYHLQGTAPNAAYKQTTSGTAAVQHSIDYSQLRENTKQIQYPAYYSNDISNVKQQTTYVPTNSKTNQPFIPSKQVPSHEVGPTYVKVQKSLNFGATVPQSQYYNPSPAVRHAENNVRYVYVQANGNPLPEQYKVPGQ